MKLTVIIANFNYARYLSCAIDSALALKWPDVEVIVVDDGSTDSSREVMRSYGDRIRAIYQPNGGQIAACNAGFAASSGDFIIFLDADDLLSPNVAIMAASVWNASVSKVQFQARVIDASGRPTGSFLPQYHGVPKPKQIRAWVLNAGAYPTPPGSANVYARWFVERVSPLRGDDRASDSYYLAAAPLLGDVLTIPEPLVSYRVHGANDGAMRVLDKTRFGREYSRALHRHAYSKRIAAAVGLNFSERALRRSFSVLPYRLASLKLMPEQHPRQGDSVLRVVTDTFRACFGMQSTPVQTRAMLFGWTALVACGPRPVAERLIEWRFASASRPRVVSGILNVLGVARYRRVRWERDGRDENVPVSARS